MAQGSKLKTEQAVTGTAPKKTLTQRVQQIVKQLGGIAVHTAADSVKASGVLADAEVLRREIEKDFKAKRQPFVEKQRQIIAEEREFTKPLETAVAAASKV